MHQLLHVHVNARPGNSDVTMEPVSMIDCHATDHVTVQMDQMNTTGAVSVEAVSKDDKCYHP